MLSQDHIDEIKSQFDKLDQHSLTEFGRVILKYWMENEPGVYDHLYQAGILKEAAIILQEQVKERIADLIEAGTAAHIAQSDAMIEILSRAKPLSEEEGNALERASIMQMMPDDEILLSNQTTSKTTDNSRF
jgi:hypothetical protein